MHLRVIIYPVCSPQICKLCPWGSGVHVRLRVCVSLVSKPHSHAPPSYLIRFIRVQTKINKYE